MTIIVGIKCIDGVVIGSDSVATMGDGGDQKTIEQSFKKIHIINGRIILAGTGEVGIGQRFKAIVEKAYQNKIFGKARTPMEVCKNLAASGIEDFLSTYSGDPRAGQFGKRSYGALIGFPIGSKIELCEFSTMNFQPELKDDNIWYVAMGSGQKIVDPFLGFIRRVFWKDNLPSLQDGKFAATWAIEHAIELNPGGINGPTQMAEISMNHEGKAEAKILKDYNLQEHRQMVEYVENALLKVTEEYNNQSGIEDIPIKK